MTAPETSGYLDPSENAGRHFVQRGIKGCVIMLNLLRLRSVADYAANPEMTPATPISGAQAFDRYIRHTLPFLRDSGGEVMLLATGGRLPIGPEDERWDIAMLIRQSSVASILSFASNHAHLAGLAHRTAAIEDSRLLPLVELPVPV